MTIEFLITLFVRRLFSISSVNVLLLNNVATDSIAVFKFPFFSSIDNKVPTDNVCISASIRATLGLSTPYFAIAQARLTERNDFPVPGFTLATVNTFGKEVSTSLSLNSSYSKPEKAFVISCFASKRCPVR